MEEKNPKDYFIIDTKTRTAPAGRDVEYVDPLANKEYKRLSDAVEDGTIADEFPKLHHNLYGRAANFHKPEHLTKECIKYVTRSDGTIWIPKSDKLVASKLLFELQQTDSGVSVSPFGLDIPAFTTPATEEEDERAAFRRKIRFAN